MNLAFICDELVRDLDRSYSSASPSNTPGVIDLIEERIAQTLKDNILKTLPGIDASVRRAGEGFIFEGAAFEVIVGRRDLLKDDTLGVVLSETSQTMKPITEQFPLSGHGRFTKIHLIFSPRLRKFVPNVSALTKAVYDSGYAWLNEFLKAKARELETSMSVALFRQLRIAFTERPQLADLIWLFVTDDTRGTYFFDERSAEQTVRRISKLKGSVRRSSAEMFFGLMITEVPYQQIFGRHSVETGEPLRIDLSKAEYLESKPIVAIAEHVLHKTATGDSQTATVFALTRNKPPYLLSCFPAAHEADIVPILRAHAAQIEATFNEHSTAVRKFLNALKRFSLESLPIELLGKFAGAFLKGYSQ